MSLSKKFSIHGLEAFTSHDGELVGGKGLATGGSGRPSVLFPSNDIVSIFDDFLGDLVADEWSYVEGDTGYSGALANVTQGVFRISGSETNGVDPTFNAALTQGLVRQWKPNQGGPGKGRLRMAWRGKIGTVTRTAEAGRTHVFVGFSDSGGAEMPVYDTGAGMISNAADLLGFLYSPTGQNADWTAVSAKSTAGDSGDQLAATGKTPVSNVYTTLEIELRSGIGDTGSTAHFWVDGIPVALITSPVNSAAALTPWVGLWVQDTGWAGQLDTDYINLSAPRDTGE